MKKIIALIAIALLPLCGAAALEQKPYEMPRTHVVSVPDSKADRQYELYIKLPEDYAEKTDTSYPVVYTTDAKWQMDMLSGATEFLMPNVILVGISWQTDIEDEREFISRLRDYTVVPLEDEEIQAKYHFGQASQHLSFIRHDVVKYVEKHYRTNPGRRAYFGYSLGALFGTYVALAEPETFHHYILGSPAVDDRDLAFFENLSVKDVSQPVNIFLSIGELEQEQMAPTNELLSMMKEKGGSGFTLTGLEIIEDSDHGTAFPETVVRGVKWLSQLNDE